MDVNKGIRQGRLTRDPELQEFGSGSVKAKFGIAINRGHKGKDGEWVETPVFVDCEAWGEGAKALAAKFRKGDPIIIEESMKMDQWEDKNGGGKRSKLYFSVERHYAVSGYDYQAHAWPGRAKPAEGGEQKQPARRKQAARAAAPAADYDEGGFPVGGEGDDSIPF